MKTTIAFFKFSSFSLVNKNLLENLRKAFINYNWEEIDAEQIYKRKSFANLIYSFCFYLSDIVRAKRPVKGMIIHTPYYFRQLKRNVKRKLIPSDYKFTFQTQSLWDLSLDGVPHFVYTDHTELAYQRYKFLDRPIYPQAWLDCEKEVYQNAELIFTTSDFCSRSVIEDYDIPAEKVICVHSGINLKHGLNDHTEKTYDSKNILFVGVEWKRKGGPQLVEAFTEIKKRHPTATLTIVGINADDVDRRYLEVQGLNFTGFVQSENLEAYFMNAQVFCLPSLVDPSAVALIEAYSYFLPVVSTRVGGTPSRVVDGKTGLLVEPDDVGSLIDKLNTLLSDPDMCREYGKNGNKLKDEHFTWEQVSNKIRHHIESFERSSQKTV